jgi:E3 ubiquitin-protein ligase SHPRH
MHGLLTQSLKGGGDADGDEYSHSLDAQGEADMYLQAYTALMADRRAALVAERTLLAEHDGREKKLRKTKAAKAAMVTAMVARGQQNPEIPEDFELRPEHEVLFKDLTNTRKSLLEDFNGRAIKSIVYVFHRIISPSFTEPWSCRIDLNAIAVSIRSDKDPEKIITKDALLNLRGLIATQGRFSSSR